MKDYKGIFAGVENTLFEIGSRMVPREQISAELEPYKHLGEKPLTDDDCYRKLVHIVFYSGFRAATVSAKLGVIDEHFPNYKRVADYDEDDIQRITNDPRMIKHEGKIRACVQNAKAIRKLVSQHGSFHAFLKSLPPTRSDREILALRDKFRDLFDFLGNITAFHFMTDIGLPVLKPDRVIQRIFKRLGLVDESQRDDALNVALIREGQKFADATGHPIRYIDIVFVAYGQVESKELGLDHGICLEINPSCDRCGAVNSCNYTRTLKVSAL